MVEAKPKRWARGRLLAVVVALTLAVFAVIGALVTLFSNIGPASGPEAGTGAPQVRQLDRDSLRHSGGRSGS